MKPHPLLSSCLLGLVLTGSSLEAHSFRLTVNSTGTDVQADGLLTLREALLFLNGEFASDLEARLLDRPLSVGESALVEEYTEDEGKNVILFALPGAGPHFLPTPVGGFPALYAEGVLIDGYSQTGAQPNTNPLTAPNNAVLKLVLDARNLIGQEGEAAPDFTLQFRAPDISLRGFSVLASTATDNYGIHYLGQASGGQISGCWFGLSPDQSILSGGEVAIAAYGSEGGHVFGTNGDGAADHAEFNVIVAHAIGVQFEETRDVRVSGNLIGVLPDGKSLPPAEVRAELEGDAIEGADLTGTITIGTNADGLADADEANVIGGMKDDVLEFYGDAETVVVAGNFIGVSADGTTPLPCHKGFRTRKARLRIGSDLDQVRDGQEGNVIAHLDSFLVQYGEERSISLRGNTLIQNTGDALFDRLEASLLFQRTGTTEGLAPTLTFDPATSEVSGTVPVSGPGSGGLRPTWVDFYFADPSTASTQPQGRQYLASFAEGGPADLDPAPLRFRFQLPALPTPASTPAYLVASAFVEDDSGFATTPFSPAVEIVLPPASPRLDLNRTAEGIRLSWADAGFQLERTESLTNPIWIPITGTSPITVPADGTSGFFRLRQ